MLLSEQAGQHDEEKDSVQYARDPGLLGELLASPVNLEHATSRHATRQGRFVNEMGCANSGRKFWSQILVANSGRKLAACDWPLAPHACYYVELTALAPTHL